jgi:hypothetical protein
MKLIKKKQKKPKATGQPVSAEVMTRVKKTSVIFCMKYQHSVAIFIR